MSDPVLHQEKLLRPVVLMLAKGTGQDKDETLQVLSLRALGNMALGAPRKVPNGPWLRSQGLEGFVGTHLQKVWGTAE